MSIKRKSKKENRSKNFSGTCFIDTNRFESFSIANNQSDIIKWYVVLGVMAIFGVMSIFLGVLNNSGTSIDLASTCFGLIVFTAIAISVIYYFEKSLKAFGAIAAFLALYTFWFFSDIKEGALNLVDNIATQIDANYSGSNIAEYDIISDNISDFIFLFGMIWIFVFLYLNRNKIESAISFLYMLPFVICVVMISVRVSVPYIILLLAYTVILFVAGNATDGRTMLAKRVNVHSIICGVSFFLVLTILANLFTPAFLFNEEKLIEFKQRFNAKAENLLRKKFENFDNKDLEKVAQGFNGGNITFFSEKPTLGNVDELHLTNNNELRVLINYDLIDKTLRGRLYLRGASYDSYYNNRWSHNYEEYVYEYNRPALENPSYLPAYFDYVGNNIEKISDEYVSGNMYVEDIHRFSNPIAFYPYFTEVDNTSSITEMEWSEGALRDYVLESDHNTYDLNFMSLQNQVDFGQYDSYVKKNMGDTDDIVKQYSKSYDDVVSGESKKQAEYVDVGDYYGNIDMPSDMEMPVFYDEFSQMLTEYNGEKIDLVNIGYNKDIGLKPCVDYVLQYLSNYKYNLKPGKTPEGQSTVDYFIENKQGYCMYFATLATFMFRRMGIAARYVEGYAVDIPRNYEGGTWLNVKNNDSHAWVEIFVPYVGWIPVEATVGSGSGYNNEPKETESVKETKPTEKKTGENQSTTKNQKETKESTKKEITADKENTKKVKLNDVLGTIARIFTALIAFAVIVGGLYILYIKYLKKKIEKIIYAYKNFDIVIFEKDLIKACRMKDVKINENFDRKANIKTLSEIFLLDKKDLKTMYDIIDRAKYSKDTSLTDSEREMLKRIINEVFDLIMSNGRIFDKLVAKIIRIKYK